MSIIIDKDTNVIVQGITGSEASYWVEKMLDCGTKIVGGVTPGKSGQEVNAIPVYNSIESLKRDFEVDLSVIFVPPKFTKGAAFEAIESGVETIVLLADGVPLQDVLEIKNFAKINNSRVIGPNTPGIATLGEAMGGFIPFWLEDVYQAGNIGLMSRSGSLTNVISSKLKKHNLGLSTYIGVGGDPVPGTRFTEVIKLFEKDDETDLIIMVGELGGTMEQEVAQLVKEGRITKPVLSYIAGEYAPKGKKMGHAGAIVNSDTGSVEAKNEILKDAGIHIAKTPEEVGKKAKELLGENK